MKIRSLVRFRIWSKFCGESWFQITPSFNALDRLKIESNLEAQVERQIYNQIGIQIARIENFAK